ncbi:ATP-binding cassette domain-containing protein [Mycobacterium sp. MYCO198283]|uniref:sulfate/molybdate ABC transporter ATP-binding protein n=1 Tax=Mycobacterium sp. MYCO198283 TaxID=2883505 RepID=UPI001E4B3E8F|nr:ATP-binding cassette domain-containing protein [Mycobacterium sp. MYCO198283]MCG5433211.1 ATP-binding cassette domain-containing protein [Mycobacterium sp. MYCO198283]
MSRLRVRAEVAARGVDVALEVAAGEVLALLGPNGAGKSTLLHVVAGLLRPDAGEVLLGDRVLTDTAAGCHAAAHTRRVGLLLQDPLLFPHLSVLHNVAFAARGRRAQRRRAAQRWLAEVGAEELAGRRPRELSGGQAQRVAIARTLASEPDALLLDEPLAGLDVAAASGLRQLLRRVLTRDGRSAVLVTHDLVDVLTLADRVAVIEAGRVAESGPAAAVLSVPHSRFAARFAGINLVAGTVADGGCVVTSWGERWYGVAETPLPTAQRAVALFAPAAVAVFPEPPRGSPRNTVAVTVAELTPEGSMVRVRGTDQPDGGPGLAADVTPAAASDLRLAVGDRVHFAVKATQVRLLPRRR